jgi:RNA polymerase sigma-70 factor (ECF subfamily)
MKSKAASWPRWRRRRHASPALALPDSRGWEGAATEAARRGDLRAWEHLTRRHQEVIFRTAYLTTRDSASAEAVTKQVFTRAFWSLRSLERGAALRPWLMGITATAARSHTRELALRRDAKMPIPDPSRRIPATPVYLDAGVPRPTPVEHAALFDAFDALADEDRLIIASRYAFGLSRADAEARLGIPADQLDGRLVAALTRLRGRLAEMMAMAIGSGSDGASRAGVGARTARYASLHDARLGTLTMAVVMSELAWTPDVAPVICARLAREVVTYPEHLDSHPAPVSNVLAQGSATRPGPDEQATAVSKSRRSASRGIGVLPMAAATLFTMAALVGMAVIVDTPGPGMPAEVRAPLIVLDTPADPGIVVSDPSELPLARSPGDPEPAVAQAPQLSIVGARTLGSGDVGARVGIDWTPVDELGTVVKTQLERKIGNGDWERVALIAAHGRMHTEMQAGRSYRFRVRSHDETGATAVSPTLRVRLAVRDHLSGGLRLAPDDWITRRGSIIQRRLIAMAPDASLWTEFSGDDVALVGPTGPTRGAIGIRIDGGPWLLDDLRLRDESPQTVVFSQDLWPGRHLLDLRAETDGVAVDAILVVRTLPV